jgi:hypothetical protein
MFTCTKEIRAWRHCTYFILYDQLWLCYLGDETDSSSVDYCWLLNTKQQWSQSKPKSQIWQKWHLTLGPLVHTLLLSWRYHLCNFIYGDGPHKLICNENHKSCCWENSHSVLWDSSEEPLFLEVKCSESLGTDVMMNKLSITKYE